MKNFSPIEGGYLEEWVLDALDAVVGQVHGLERFHMAEGDERNFAH